MPAVKTNLNWLFLLLILAINFTESRYLNNEKTENELSNQNSAATDADDDIDLETVLEDYYDDLWQYFETWLEEIEKAEKKEKEDSKGKPDYDYMSDMAVADAEVDEKKFKNLDKNSMAIGKENLTKPFLKNSESKDNGISEDLRAYRERTKEMRLKSIKDQLLKIGGRSLKKNETIPDAKQYNALGEIYEKNIRRIKNEESTSYTEKVQSFYPSCEMPQNTDEDVWSDPLSMNLLFDLDFPTPQEDSTTMIVSAKLRLYKLSQENYSLPNLDTSMTKIKSNGFGILPGDDDRQIRVSVYWYTRSLRRHRIKKKLLDSQMLSIYGTKWVEFNIRSAVRTWKESGRNFGLVVSVEDEDGALLPTEQYIHSMNCSKWTATVRPIPSIVMDRVNQYFIESLTQNRNETAEESKGDEDKHKIYPYQPLLFPIVDLCTREVPNSDVKSIALADSAKKVLESKFLNLSKNGFMMSNDTISIFLKKNNLDKKENSKLSRVDKSIPRKSETKSRVSYFQNVAIGSPINQNENNLNSTKRREAPDFEVKSKIESPEADVENIEDGKMPRIRHNRKPRDLFQKSTNSPSLRINFHATEHY